MKKLTISAKAYLIIGLFILCTVQILRHYLTMPDFAAGALMGIGIGVEILALIKLNKAKLLVNR